MCDAQYRHGSGPLLPRKSKVRDTNVVWREHQSCQYENYATEALSLLKPAYAQKALSLNNQLLWNI